MVQFHSLAPLDSPPPDTRQEDFEAIGFAFMQAMSAVRSPFYFRSFRLYFSTKRR
jgi:hypothetical protein